MTAVIPTWNRRDLLLRALSSLTAQTRPPREILVVDNGSTDGAPEAAEAAGARVLRMGRNAGFATAVNAGIRAARSEWIAVVNNDVELAPDYCQLLLRALDASGAWFATGKILSARRDRTLDGSFDVLCRGGCALRAGHGQPDGPAFAAQRKIFSAPWTAALFRAGLFDKTGLLEERFESYLEDVDFGARCASLGLAGLYVPEAVAWHEGSATLGRWSAATVRRLSRNQLLLAARWLAFRDCWHIAVAQSLWGFAALRHGAGRPWLRGKLEALRAWPHTRSTYSPSRRNSLDNWLREGEGIVRRDRSTFWRVYSLLTPSGAL